MNHTALYKIGLVLYKSTTVQDVFWPISAFTSPLKTFKHIIWRHYKWHIIGVIVAILLLLIIIIFVCTLPVSHTTFRVTSMWPKCDLLSDQPIVLLIAMWPAMWPTRLFQLTLEPLAEFCDCYCYGKIRGTMCVCVTSLHKCPCSPSCSQSMCSENQMKSYCVKWLLLEAFVSKVETLFVLANFQLMTT